MRMRSTRFAVRNVDVPAANDEDAVEQLRAFLVVQVELRADAEALGEVRPGRRALDDHEPIAGSGTEAA